MPTVIQSNQHPYHAESTEKVLALLKTSEEGLELPAIAHRLEQYGKNILPDPTSRHPLTLLLNQLKSVMVYILLIAALISYVSGEKLDVAVIIGIVIANTIFGFYQEYRAERSIQALKQLIVPKAKVIRSGAEQIIDSKDLVPGDILSIAEGDLIPADARLLSLTSLQAVEAALTGESNPVEKSINPLPPNTPLADRKNMVYTGTQISRGEGKAVVIATGQRTVLGSIARNLETIEEKPDHFKVKTDLLAQQMGLIAIVTTILTFLIGYYIRHFSFSEIFMFAIASLVSGVPEGLPVIMTMVLAISAQRMAKRNAIVRRLPATETFAVVDTIITDKTGTLTENRMTALAIELPLTPSITVIPINNKIALEQNGKPFTKANLALYQLLDIAYHCHDVRREISHDNTVTYFGDPTEIALLSLAENALNAGLYDPTPFNLRADLPFSQEYRLRASLVEQDDKNKVVVIGAPENVLKAASHVLKSDGSKIPLKKEQTEEVTTRQKALSQRGMRVLALALKDAPPKTLLNHQVVDKLTFVGLVGIVDPPRKDVPAAIKLANKAGVKTIMATGDHPETAKAIARDIGLLTNLNETSAVLTQTDLELLTDNQLFKRLNEVVVFARMTPDSKLRIARLLQKQGHVVAMTGDGINDAPALKQADVGIAMGKNGTDVARESADVILSDDNYATIVSAIEEGRTQFRNVRRTSFFLTTTNLAESLSLIVFLMVGLPIPLLPKQILWLNLITGGVTDLALATEPIHDDVLNSPPNHPNENILSNKVFPLLIITAITMIVLSLAVFIALENQGFDVARTGVFAVLSITQLFNLLNVRSLKNSILSAGLFSNKGINLALISSIAMLISVLYIPKLRTLFSFSYLPPTVLVVIALLSSLLLWFVELQKYLNKIIPKKTT